MKAKLLAFTLTPTSSGEILDHFNLEEATNFCAKMAGICYCEEDFSKLLNEDIDLTSKRKNQTLQSGHHSVYDHFKLTFEFQNISKIVAMILNNENDYDTSEKSARYTHFNELEGIEGELYTKWCEKLAPLIKETYPKLVNEKAKNPLSKIQKLAQENARLFVSVFTRTTNMGHTISLRQLNYIIYIMKDFITNNNDYSNVPCKEKIANELKEFVELFDDYIVPSLIPTGKCRRLSLFGEETYRNLPDVFSYVYQTQFETSLAATAQNHRHRSENYFIHFLDEYKFYVPEILDLYPDVKKEWLEDSLKVKDILPQGQLIKLTETGTIDTFFLKCTERLCGSAQLEIMRTTLEVYQKFTESSPFYDSLLEKTNNCTARCRFKDARRCGMPCIFGAKQDERKI